MSGGTDRGTGNGRTGDEEPGRSAPQDGLTQEVPPQEVAPQEVAPQEGLTEREPASTQASSAAGASAVRIPRRRGLQGPPGAVAAVLVLGATVALATGALIPRPAADAFSYDIPGTAVPAGDYTAVCAGPPRLLGVDAGGIDPEFSPVSKSAKTRVSAMVLGDLSGALPGSDLSPLSGGDPLAVLATGPAEGEEAAPPASSDSSGLTSRTAGVAGGTAVQDASVFRAEPLGAQTPVAGAMFSYTARDGDLRGLAAAPCQAPSNDLWILGADTTVGSTSVLLLSNPTQTPATVDLELTGAEGPVEASGGTGLLVPPGQTRQLVLGGLAAGQEQLAVRVRSTGGRITAFVQQSVLRGLTPGGVELLTPTAGPADTQVLPGVAIQDAATARRIREQKGYEGAAPALQVLVPGTSDAVLDVVVLGPDGELTLDGGGVVTARAGALTTLPLDELPEGNYTVAISADVPVSAAVRVSRGTGPGKPVDQGLAVAAARIGGDSSVVFADGTDASLVFGSPSGRSEVSVTGIRADGTLGTPKIFNLAGGTSVAVTASDLMKGAAAAVISATGDPVYGAQVNTLSDAAGISVSAVPPGATGRESIPIVLGY
ncbi:hypothetical protein E2F48_06425 [Arthrobacter crusticola]|uniref:Large extracellular alpha-helical protein n=1 Tax=Arthrobacter crusticola TaxID=2547960 RepID=A0A4R5U008_9MICC|nr:DUF5719 family protein [Arthrobacter crusticola]TDK26801.1 hypothetical protein E2F48_06425 [Arthrobacter crusticola]